MAKWTVRDKTIRLINRWYLIFLAFLISAGLAWGVMHLWPPQHKASTTVYIGIDINRVFDVSSMAAYAETEPFNIDDYKNWQLSQLDAIARSEQVAKETLANLRDLNPYWNDISPREFVRLEDVDWWDMGTWRLTISDSDPDRAGQAVQEWRSVFVDQVSSLVSQAKSAYKLDGKLRALNLQQVQVETEISEFVIIEEKLRDFRSGIERLERDQPLEPFLRWQLWGLATGSSDFTPMWTEVLEEFPDTEQEVSAYIKWIDEFLTVLSAETEVKEDSLKILEEEEDSLTDQFVEEIQKSGGLSPNLTIEQSSSKVHKSSGYPGAMVALLGGVIGVVIYLIVFLFITELPGNRKR